MPKKKKKSKSNKKISRKKKSKIKNKSFKKSKLTKRKTKAKKKLPKKRNSKKTKIDNSLQETIFKTRPEWIKNGLANKFQYQNKYNESIKNNVSFWKKEGKRITWIKPYKKIQ